MFMNTNFVLCGDRTRTFIALDDYSIHYAKQSSIIIIKTHKENERIPTTRALGGFCAYYARGRWFDSCAVQTFVCKNMSVLGLGVSMYNMYVFPKRMYISMYLSVIWTP
jgi:hypothetical protein